MVENPPVIQEMWAHSLGLEDHLEEEIAPTLVFLLKNSCGHRSLADYCPWACKELDTTERLS